MKYPNAFTIRVPDGWLEELDRWRATRLDQPTRTSAIRQLVASGMKVLRAKTRRVKS